MECLIPFVAATLIKNIDEGCELPVVIGYGLLLILLACISLTFGALAGSACATASCGFAKNLRHDLFVRVQGFSFENIDRFSSASLVTRLTTDVTNVQMAYMMLIRVAIRSPLMLVFALVMAFVMGGSMAVIFLAVVPVLAIGIPTIVDSATLVLEALEQAGISYDAYPALREILENGRSFFVTRKDSDLAVESLATMLANALTGVTML